MESKTITLTDEEINFRIESACRSLSRKKFTPNQLKQFIINGKIPNKRSKSGYQLFLDDFRKPLSKEKRAKIGQVSKDGAAAWKELDMEKKQNYLDKANELKQINILPKNTLEEKGTKSEPEDWHPRDDVDDTIPEGWEMDDLGGVCDGDITWREDGKYFHWDKENWIFPQKTPKGEKIPEFPQELKDFYEGTIYQTWKKVSPQAHQVKIKNKK